MKTICLFLFVCLLPVVGAEAQTETETQTEIQTEPQTQPQTPPPALKPITVEFALVCDAPSENCREAQALEQEELVVEKEAQLTQDDIASISMRMENVPQGLKELNDKREPITNFSTILTLSLTQEGKEDFAALTGANIGKRLGILIDGKIINAPKIQTRIDSGIIQIMSDFTEQDAKEIMARINKGVEAHKNMPVTQ